MVVLLISAASLSACSSPTPNPTSGTSARTGRSIIAGPAGLMAGTPPTLTGEVWLLAGSSNERTLHELNLSDGKLGAGIPVDGNATSLSQSSSTLLGLGVSTLTSGSVDFLAGANGSPVSTVAVGAPVRAVTVGANGSTFYALNGTNMSSSVTLIDSLAKKIVDSVPVPLDTVSIGVDPTQQRLFALESSGQVDIIAVFGGQVLSRFPVGARARALVISGDGSTMYVLKGGGSPDNVGVFDLARERQTRALAVPSNTVAISVSADDSTLYAFVGTPTIGNVQLIRTN